MLSAVAVSAAARLSPQAERLVFLSRLRLSAILLP